MVTALGKVWRNIAMPFLQCQMWNINLEMRVFELREASAMQN